MTASPTERLHRLAGLIGTDVGVSAWKTIDQELIDGFAAMTGDDGPIHTDPELGVAYVMGANVPGNGSPDPAELRSFAAERLANYKIPKHIEVLDELPMLPIGKVDKKQLEARAQEDAS